MADVTDPASARPIRAVYDVSFLGRVQSGPKRSVLRGGIFRMVEQSTEALSHSPELQLWLSANERMLNDALKYVAAQPELRPIPFAAPMRTRVGTRIRAHAVMRHKSGGARIGAALPARVANRIAGDANRLLDRLERVTRRGTLARADVFHSPFDPLPAAVERVRGVRYAITIHDLIPLVRPEVGDAEWLREILRSIGPEDQVLTVSEHTRTDLLSACPAIAPERVAVARLAADPARFYPCVDPERLAAVRTRYRIPHGPYILAVGALAPHKNIPRLIAAFGEVVRAERTSDLRLVITGAKGWGYEPIFEQLTALGPDRDRVMFTGYVDDADLAPLYSGALAFAFPSYYEGFGLPPLEAMQCGTPVVASSAASLPEVVGDAGVLVDPHDGDALADALLTIYRDGDLRSELSRRGLARAREFTWARHAAQTVAAYRRSL